MNFKEYQEECLRTCSQPPQDTKVDWDTLALLLALYTDIGHMLNLFKKSIFYDTHFDLDDWNSHLDSVRWLTNELDFSSPNENKTDSNISIQTLHGIISILTESSELAAILGSNPHDRITKLFEELGDLQWSQAILLKDLGFTLNQIREGNIAKLRKRFPDGFNSHDANFRDKQAEQVAMKDEMFKTKEEVNG